MYENEYCDQDDFSFLICGGMDKNEKDLNKVLEVKVPSFEACDFNFMIKPRSRFSLHNMNNDILAIGGDKSSIKLLEKSIKSVEIYSNETNTWQQQYIQVEEKFNFSVCIFRKELFIIGGWIKSSDISSKSCFKYNMKVDKWTQIADLKVKRDTAACTVFEGKIVVTGGENDYDELKSVEA